MKNIIKMVSVFALVFFGQQAFAACWANANQIPHGTPPLFHNAQTGMWCTTQAHLQQGQQVVFPVQRAPVFTVPANAVYVPVGTPAPQGLCSWGDRFVNIGAGAVAGAVIGALAGDNQRAAGQGAAAGALAGVFIPCNQVSQGTQQTQQNLVNQGVQGGQRTSGVACSTGGETFLVESDAQCARMAMKIASATQASGSNSPGVNTQTVTAINTPDGKIGCTINTGTESFRFNAVQGVRIDGAKCEAYRTKQIPLPDRNDMQLL